MPPLAASCCSDSDPNAPEGFTGTPTDPCANLTSVTLAPAVRLKVEGRTFTTAEGKEAETAGIVWMGEDSVATAAKVLGERQEPKKLEIATNFLREVLADGPLPRAEVQALADDEDITLATLKRAANTLGIESKREEFGTWSSWSLPRTRLMLQKNEPRERVVSQKPLQDKGSTTRLIASENLSHEPSDEPRFTHGSSRKAQMNHEPRGEPSEPSGLENVRAVLQVDDVEHFPNGHPLHQTTAPNEPLPVDESEGSEQTAPLPWEDGAAGTPA